MDIQLPVFKLETQCMMGLTVQTLTSELHDFKETNKYHYQLIK